MLEVSRLPLRVDAVEQQGFRRAEGVKHLTFRLGDIDVLQLVECSCSSGQGIGAERSEVRQSGVLGGGLVIARCFCRFDLRVARYALLPKLEAEVLTVARQ